MPCNRLAVVGILLSNMRKLFQTDEQKLVKACLAGKPDAQRELYDRYSGKMFAVCLRYARNRDEAADMLQDGMVRVFQKLELYEGKGSLEGWVRRVIVNVAIRQYQRNSRLYVVGVEEADEEAVSGEIEANLNYQEMMEMVQGLPDGYRLVFNLYAIEGFSHKEIAEQLEISEGTSKSQLARARKQLMQQVEARMGIKEKKMIVES